MHLKLETLIATPFSVEVPASKYILKTVRATIKMPFRTTKESHWWTAKSFLFLNHWLESISYKALGSFSVCKLNMCQAGISIERRFTPASRSQGFPYYSFPSYIFIFWGFADWKRGNEIIPSRKKPSPTLFSYTDIHLPWMKVIRTRFASFFA